jgi:hypothetical protein
VVGNAALAASTALYKDYSFTLAADARACTNADARGCGSMLHGFMMMLNAECAAYAKKIKLTVNGKVS